MIKNILFVSLLLAGGTLWASAQSQTTEGAAASLPASKKENMTISQLFQKVEDNSKSLRTSLSGVEAAHLGIESAKSKKLPDLDASLSFSYIGNALITDRDFSNVHGLKSPHFGNNFAFQAQQVVYAGGAINAGIKLAELGKQQAEVGVKLTRQQIRFIALGQYLDLYKIDNRIKVYEKNIELTRQLIDDIKEKQTHGMALKNDITRYELQMESLKLGLTALRNNRSILNHQLCNTLGMNQEDKGNRRADYPRCHDRRQDLRQGRRGLLADGRHDEFPTPGTEQQRHPASRNRRRRLPRATCCRKWLSWPPRILTDLSSSSCRL